VSSRRRPNSGTLPLVPEILLEARNGSVVVARHCFGDVSLLFCRDFALRSSTEKKTSRGNRSFCKVLLSTDGHLQTFEGFSARASAYQEPAAYEKTLRTIGLVDRDDPITEMIARKLIEIAQTGVQDPAQLSAMAIREIGIP
jgi:hypothetical protein